MKQRLHVGFVLVSLCGVRCASGQQCTTQSQMQAPERSALVRAATDLAKAMQANDVAAVRQQTVPEVVQNFSGIANTVATLAPHVQNATFVPESVWLLDAKDNKAGADGRYGDVQFFCNLNGGAQAAVFSLQALPAGRYGVAILDAAQGQPPYRVTLLLRESGRGTWQLGGLFPRPSSAAGHDGLWYWKAARTDAAKKQSWNAWLNYAEAERLLRPAGFISSSHLEQLQEEQSKAAPTALSGGLSESTPLIVKAKDGAEYRVTALGPDDSLGGDRIDVAMHFTAEAIADPVAARARNQKAAAALLAAYPELRETIHGAWVYADGPNGQAFASEEPISALR